ncbi:unnamed protein product, partial [Staurois parvus]
PGGGLDLEKAQLHQRELEEGVGSHQLSFTILNQSGEGIIQHLSSADGAILQEKLVSLNKRWGAIKAVVMERQQRLKEENPALSEYRRKKNDEFTIWLEQAASVIRVNPALDNKEKLNALKAFNKDLGTQSEKVEWLNRAAPDMLALKFLSAQDREKLSTRLRTINISWAQVSREVPENIKDLERGLYYPTYTTQPLMPTFPPVQKMVLVSSASEFPGVAKHVV